MTWNVNNEDIKALGPEQLVELLRRLLLLEARQIGIPASQVHVPHNINIPDGGEDGRIDCGQTPLERQFITHSLMIFQAKATSMTSRECENEIFRSRTNNLKPCFNDILDRNDRCYVLFCNQDLVQEAIDDRIRHMHQSIQRRTNYGNRTINLQIYDASKISTWVNQHISAIVLVKHYIGKSLPENMLTWHEWHEQYSVYTDEAELQERHEQPSPKKYKKYIEDIELIKLREQVHSYLNKRNCIRVSGFSGVGKTFFVHNLICAQENQNLLNDAVYIDARYAKNILSAVHMWLRNNQSCLLIVDNCKRQFHEQLAREIKNEFSNITLITISEGMEENSSPEIDLLLQLSPARDTFKILSEELSRELGVYPFITQADYKMKGYPKFALDYLNYLKTGNSGYDNSYYEHLLFGKNSPDRTVRKVIMICSLFTQIEFEYGYNVMRPSIEYLSELADIDYDEFYEISMHYLFQRGMACWMLVKGVGGFTLPLMANKFSIDWWIETSPRRIADFIWEITDKHYARDFFKKLSEISKNDRVLDKLHNVCDVLDIEQLDLTDYYNLKLMHHLADIIPGRFIFLLSYQRYIDSLNPNNFAANEELFGIFICLCRSPFYFKQSSQALLELCASNKLIFLNMCIKNLRDEIEEADLQQNGLNYDLAENYVTRKKRINYRSTMTSSLVPKFIEILYRFEPEDTVFTVLERGLLSKNVREKKIVTEIIIELLNRTYSDYFYASYEPFETSNISLETYEEKALELLNKLFTQLPMQQNTPNAITNALVFCHELRRVFLRSIHQSIDTTNEPLNLIRNYNNSLFSSSSKKTQGINVNHHNATNVGRNTNILSQDSSTSHVGSENRRKSI